MGAGKTALSRLVGMFVFALCVAALSWVVPSRVLMPVVECAERADRVPGSAARFSGKVTMELVSTHEDPGGTSAQLDMAMDGKLRLQARPGVSCDISASARPHPGGRGALGYVGVSLAAKPGGGFLLDLDARSSRSCDTDDFDEPAADNVSNLLRAALGWKSSSGRVASKVVWEGEGVVFPNRPSSDHTVTRVDGELKTVPTKAVSASAGASSVDRRYHVAPLKSSTSNTSWCEVGVDAGGAASGEFRLEARRVVYPGSSTRTYTQRTQEVGLSWVPRPRLAVELLLSQVDKAFPAAREKDLTDREITARVRMGGILLGALTLEGTSFQRRVPSSSEDEYNSQSIRTELESVISDCLSFSANCVISRRAYADPAEADGGYSDTEIACKMTYDISEGTQLTCEAQVERRQYRLDEEKDKQRFTSTMAVVYRF